MSVCEVGTRFLLISFVNIFLFSSLPLPLPILTAHPDSQWYSPVCPAALPRPWRSCLLPPAPAPPLLLRPGFVQEAASNLALSRCFCFQLWRWSSC